MGELDAVATLDEPGLMTATSYSAIGGPHIVRLRFNQDHLTVEEENWIGIYGFNVNFIGNYRKA